MSAYIVEQKVIGFIVNAGMQYGLIDPMNAVSTGRMLWVENQKSIHARYGSGDDYGNIGEITKRMELGLFAEFNPSQVIKCCGNYAYQACEHDGWEESEARELVDRIVEAAKAAGGKDTTGELNCDLVWGAPEPTEIVLVDIPRDVSVTSTV